MRTYKLDELFNEDKKAAKKQAKEQTTTQKVEVEPQTLPEPAVDAGQAPAPAPKPKKTVEWVMSEDNPFRVSDKQKSNARDVLFGELASALVKTGMYSAGQHVPDTGQPAKAILDLNNDQIMNTQRNAAHLQKVMDDIIRRNDIKQDWRYRMGADLGITPGRVNDQLIQEAWQQRELDNDQKIYDKDQQRLDEIGARSGAIDENKNSHYDINEISKATRAHRYQMYGNRGGSGSGGSGNGRLTALEKHPYAFIGQDKEAFKNIYQGYQNRLNSLPNDDISQFNKQLNEEKAYLREQLSDLEEYGFASGIISNDANSNTQVLPNGSKTNTTGGAAPSKLDATGNLVVGSDPRSQQLSKAFEMIFNKHIQSGQLPQDALEDLTSIVVELGIKDQNKAMDYVIDAFNARFDQLYKAGKIKNQK